MTKSQSVVLEQKIERVVERVLKRVLREAKPLRSLEFLAERGGSFDFLKDEPELYSVSARIPRRLRRG